MLSFDISDRQINIVKGDNSSNKIRIERSLQVDIPEDMILNGEVINLSGLSELLLTQIKAEDMMDKDAIVTFSSSNIVFKELALRKSAVHSERSALIFRQNAFEEFQAEKSNKKTAQHWHKQCQCSIISLSQKVIKHCHRPFLFQFIHILLYYTT